MDDMQQRALAEFEPRPLQLGLDTWYTLHQVSHQTALAPASLITDLVCLHAGNAHIMAELMMASFSRITILLTVKKRPVPPAASDYLPGQEAAGQWVAELQKEGLVAAMTDSDRTRDSHHQTGQDTDGESTHLLYIHCICNPLT